MPVIRTSRQEQRDHVVRWLESRLSKAAYCRQVGLPYHSLGYWARRFADLVGPGLGSDPVSGFVELTAHPSGRSPSAPLLDCRGDFDGRSTLRPAVVIRLPGGAELACGSLPDPEWVRRLTRGVGSC